MELEWEKDRVSKTLQSKLNMRNNLKDSKTSLNRNRKIKSQIARRIKIKGLIWNKTLRDQFSQKSRENNQSLETMRWMM